MMFMLLLGCQVIPTGDLKCADTIYENGKEIPEYLVAIWPRPNSTLSKSCYEDSFDAAPPLVEGRGIGFTINTFEVVDIPDKLDDWGEMPYQELRFKVNAMDLTESASKIAIESGERAFIRIDGKDYVLGSGSYTFSWAENLEPGIYVAALDITSNLGNVRTFEWSFEIK